MISFSAAQQALIDSAHKIATWLFEVDTGSILYHWSSKSESAITHPEETIQWDTNIQWDTDIQWDASGGTSHTYSFKIVNFDGITQARGKSEYGIQAPNDISFSVINSGNTLTASDFEGASVYVALLFSDGTDTELIRKWKFMVKSCLDSYEMLDFVCVDYIQQYLDGDYPNGPTIGELSPSTDTSNDDQVCVPVPVGTAYIPLRSVHINADNARYYVIGPASHAYSITKVHSPMNMDESSEWESSEYSFNQYTKTIGGINYRVFQPIIMDIDADSVADAPGFFRIGSTFQDIPTEFTRSDTYGLSNPSDFIRFVLNDFGIDDSLLDLPSFSGAKTTYASWGLEFNGGFYYKMTREEALSSLLIQCHSQLIIEDKIKLKVFSKTSQTTITSVLKGKEEGPGTFQYDSILNTDYDSGYVLYQESSTPQDSFISVLVPAKATTDRPSSDEVITAFITDSQDAQRAGSLYYQKIYLPTSMISFVSKAKEVGIEPGDVITLNHARYGGNYPVLIDQVHIGKDASVEIECIKLSDTLDDWTDLSPDAVSVGTDDTENVWRMAISGPDTPLATSKINSSISIQRLGSSGLAGISGAESANTDYRFWAGAYDADSAPFRVDENGQLTTSDIIISGLGAGSDIDGQYITDATVTLGKLNISELSDISTSLGEMTSGQFDSLTIVNNLTIGGTVDGVDIAALETDVDEFPDELKNLVTAEIQQLENIGAETISAVQWGYLGEMDQSVITTADLVLGSLDVNGESRCNSFRLDQTPTAETPTPTHTFTFNLNGTTYRIPCLV